MRLDRLYTLWEFLTTENIPGRKWNFRQVNSDKKLDKFNCCNAGCTIGEFPIIWKEFHFNTHNYMVMYRNFGSHEANVAAAADFFDITYPEAHQLFNYECLSGRDIYHKSKILRGSATRKDITDNLKTFIIKATDKELHSQKR